jgi:hypothetical protein
MNKQETLEEAKLRAANYMSLKGALEPKQETIEEAGVAYAKTVNENHTSHMLGFYNGAKWQQERMYSEEDMINFAFDTYHYISELMKVPFNQISENKLHAMYNFEQFKNK